MPPIEPNTLVAVLWGLTVVLLGWTWLPALIAAFGGTSFRNWYSEDTAELEPAGGDPDYKLWYEQARQLGYEPLGAGWIKILFYGPEWQHLDPSRAFYSAPRRTYFFILRFPPPASVWASAQLASPLADGGLLTTGNGIDAFPDFEAEYVRQGKGGCDDLAELELLHAAALEVLGKQGRPSDADGTVENVLEMGRRNWAPAAKRSGAKAGWNYLLLHVIIHACVSIPAAEVFGFAHIGVPVTNLALWLLMAISSLGERQTKAAIVRATVERSIARRGVR